MTNRVENANTIILHNAQCATMATNKPYGLIDQAAIVICGTKIAWVGTEADLPKTYAHCKKHDVGGQLITPAFVDCHTHLIHGGHRADEFARALGGASYAEIAEVGGIRSTVRATRNAAVSELLHDALARLDRLLAEGVCTVEVKSGYGLSTETECTMLRTARQLADSRAVRIRTTFLGAHAVPEEFSGRPDDYIDYVCDEMLPAAHTEGLVDAVDVFCETIGFTTAQTARVFDTARALGLPVKIHAEQLSNQGGAALAAQYGALSADHLEYLDDAGVATMANAGTVAVLLPGAFYCLRETQQPPIAALRTADVPMAVATDANPGSSPLTSLLTAMHMACTFFRLTPEESLRGVTCHAARALGITDIGTIAPDYAADLAIWDVESPNELAYRIGFNPLSARIFQGKFV